MKSIVKAATLGLVLAVMATPAMAQSDKERKVCQRDAVRWCKGSLITGDETIIRGCFAAHKALLTPKCKAALANHGM